jgi:hypothetical protein
MHVLVSILTYAAASIVARVLFTMGMSFVVFQGLDQLQGLIVDNLNQLAGTLPADAAAIMAKMGLFTALSVIVSAYLASISLTTALVGAKRLVMNPSGS